MPISLPLYSVDSMNSVLSKCNGLAKNSTKSQFTLIFHSAEEGNFAIGCQKKKNTLAVVNVAKLVYFHEVLSLKCYFHLSCILVDFDTT